MELDTAAAVEARLAYYEEGDGSKEWAPNPIYSPDDEALNRSKVVNDTFIILGPLLLMATVFLLAFAGLSFIAADPSGTLNVEEEHARALKFLLGGAATAFLTFVVFKIDVRVGAKQKALPERDLLMDPAMGRAWTDWSQAFCSTAELDSSSEAHQALLEQDAVLREALQAYLYEEAPEAQKAQFEAWFKQRCAEAYVLREAELYRDTLVSEFTPNQSLALAMSMDSRVGQAVTHSAQLSAHVQSVLSPSGEGEPVLSPAKVAAEPA